MSETVRLTLDEVHALATEAFLANGGSPEQTRAVADTVTAAERDECKSHGLFRVPGYIASVRSGKVNAVAEPKVERLAPGVVKVDGFNGFAPLALEVGREPLVELAREQGIAALAITNTHHFAALWPETEALAERGLVGFAFVAAMAYVAPAGGTKPLYGTNPMSFAWPRGEGRPPLVFDQASSASARGEIMIHQRDGHPLPEGWGIDADGNPTTDPAAALAGAQLPFGGYKGASIALMIELLAGALVGDLFSFEASDSGPRRRRPAPGRRARARDRSQAVQRRRQPRTPRRGPLRPHPRTGGRPPPLRPSLRGPPAHPHRRHHHPPAPSTTPSPPSAAPDPTGWGNLSGCGAVRGLPVRRRPWIDRPDTGVSELPFVSGDDGKPAIGGRSGEHGVREMAVERFAPSTFFFHDARACLCVGGGPGEHTVFKEFVQQVPDSLGKTRPVLSGIEQPDAVEHLPDGDGRKAESFSRDGVEKPRDARLRARPHHFRDDVRIEEPGEGRVHPPRSSVNLTGR